MLPHGKKEELHSDSLSTHEIMPHKGSQSYYRGINDLKHFAKEKKNVNLLSTECEDI